VEIVAASINFTRLIGMRYPATLGLFGQIRPQHQGRIFTRQEVVEHGYSPVLREADVRSALVVPLISRNELIGALSLTRHGANAVEFTPANLELMEAFASRAAVAIDNAQLLKDLGRKNNLLQLLIEEAHHRIKNNLQMISGLLQLEADTAQVGPTAGFLRTAITRIQAIAQVHNLLSEEMPEKVDIRTLIATIIHTLVSSASGTNGAPEVAVEVEPLWLGADQAVPLALIVNELVSNSFLHGCPFSGQPLRVQIQCRQQDDHMQLVVADNGGGFDDGKDWREFEGQGMNIVAQLAQVNLRGDLQIHSRDGGVRAELRFEIVLHGPGPAERNRSVLAAARA
jgi:two-component sensor histidine kinase